MVLADVGNSTPDWIGEAEWLHCDLRSPSAGAIIDRTHKSIIISMDPPSLSGSWHHKNLLTGLASVLEAASRCGVLRILHISSVAAARHNAAQVNASETDELPPVDTYTASFDAFKRKCEATISEACAKHGIAFTHIRIGSVFQDTADCGQCGALALLSRVGSYVPTAVDYNTSSNVVLAVHTVMNKMKGGEDVDPLYYYTRPSPDPSPYGKYLREYMDAYGVKIGLWVPFWLLILFLWPINLVFFRYTPLGNTSIGKSIASILYLNSREHSFDNTRFRTHFSDIIQEEESTKDFFVRRQKVLQHNNKLD